MIRIDVNLAIIASHCTSTTFGKPVATSFNAFPFIDSAIKRDGLKFWSIKKAVKANFL